MFFVFLLNLFVYVGLGGNWLLLVKIQKFTKYWILSKHFGHIQYFRYQQYIKLTNYNLFYFIWFVCLFVSFINTLEKLCTIFLLLFNMIQLILFSSSYSVIYQHFVNSILKQRNWSHFFSKLNFQFSVTLF